MLTIPTMLLALLITWLTWKGLDRTGLPQAAKFALVLLVAFASAVVLFLGGVYLSLYLFQARDVPTL